MENKPYKTIGRWEIYNVTTPEILNYRLRGQRKKSFCNKIWNEITIVNNSEEEEPTINAALDKRFGHTEEEAKVLLEKEIEEKINRFEESWKICHRSERTAIKQSFQGEENPVAIAYKRGEKINFIRLFELNWVEISWVKQSPHELGAEYYYEITLDSGKSLKINNDEIWLATPSGQRLEREKGIKSIRTIDKKDSYRDELFYGEMMLLALNDICKVFTLGKKLTRASQIPYLIWAEQKLGYSLDQKFRLEQTELFKPHIPYPI